MTGARPPFAHASEAELARILDFYAVAWQYEPTTFPILFDRSGNVRESFTPDFYLPDLDIYVELTTLKQRLVRKKNRKLRRLRELYPAIRVKLLYARDFRALMLKYGRLALADALSGADGQTTPARAGRARTAVPVSLAAVADGVPGSPAADPAAAAVDVPGLVVPPTAEAPSPGDRGAGPAPALARPRTRRVRRTRSEARARAAARAAAAESRERGRRVDL